MWVPSDRAANGTGAVSLAVVDRNGSHSSASSRSPAAASMRPPLLTTGKGTAPAAAKPVSAISVGKRNGTGFSDQ